MNPQEIINLIGSSEYSPEIKKIFKQLGIPIKQQEMPVSWRTYQSTKWDLSLVFRAKNNFLSDYGPYKLAFTDSYEEAFLEEINFGSYKASTNYPFSLPYNLTFSDKPIAVTEKVSMKASESSPASYGSYMLFYTDGYKILTGFDNNNRLIWVSVRPLTLGFIKKRELTKSFRQQNKNIAALTSKQSVQLRRLLPAAAWRKRMKKGDNSFNEEKIGETEKILQIFIDNLISASEQRKASAIYSAIRKVVLKINTLNDKYYGFIETMEREELVEFINKAVQLTGFKIDKGADLTEEWREW
jgi:hypothetical protein